MAATTAGAVKAWVEAGGLGVAVYRDVSPDEATMPFVTVQEAISVTPDASGDNGADPTVREAVQVDLWQPLGDETYTLPDALAKRLHGAHLPDGRTHVYGVTVDFMVRLVERESAVVHHAITCSVRRAL